MSLPKFKDTQDKFKCMMLDWNLRNWMKKNYRKYESSKNLCKLNIIYW